MPKRSTVTLSAKFCETAKAPKAGMREVFDAAMPGMSLRIYKTGVRTFTLAVRAADSRTGRKMLRRVRLGHFPAMKLAEARAKAGDLKDRARAGEAIVDDSEAKLPAPDRITFREVAAEYVTRGCDDMAERTRKEREAQIERLTEAWGDRPFAEIRKAEAYQLLDAVKAKHPAAAHALHQAVKRLANWCVQRDLIESSPLTSIRSPVKVKPRQRHLNAAELRAMWHAAGDSGYPFGTLARLLALTGQRRSEVASMRWLDLDLEKATWTIPAAMNKSGREHLVPLAPAAVDLLRDLPRFAGPFVLTSTGGERPVSGFSKGKTRLDELMAARLAKDGLELAEWRFHDLRRTVRTGMAELGAPEIVAEAVLNHARQGLAKVYNIFEYQAEKREALEAWARRLHEIVTPPPANVVDHPRRRRSA